MRFLFVVCGAALLFSACSGKDSPDTPAVPTAEIEQATMESPAAASSPVPSATAEPSGRDILQRSDAAMATAGYVVTESYSWSRNGTVIGSDIVVEETDGPTRRHLGPADGFEVCKSVRYPTPRYSDREDGALGDYSSEMGASRPGEVELLGEEHYEGEDAWLIRFRYMLPSTEGPYPIEHTEWVAKDDYRLLRQELETFDPFGLVGQTVVRFVEYRDNPSECPRQPSLSTRELEPVTTPRLESPR